LISQSPYSIYIRDQHQYPSRYSPVRPSPFEHLDLRDYKG